MMNIVWHFLYRSNTPPPRRQAKTHSFKKKYLYIYCRNACAMTLLCFSRSCQVQKSLPFQFHLVSLPRYVLGHWRIRLLIFHFPSSFSVIVRGFLMGFFSNFCLYMPCDAQNDQSCAASPSLLPFLSLPLPLLFHISQVSMLAAGNRMTSKNHFARCANFS